MHGSHLTLEQYVTEKLLKSNKQTPLTTQQEYFVFVLQ